MLTEGTSAKGVADQKQAVDLLELLVESVQGGWKAQLVRKNSKGQ